ncbi:PepSY-like domain-containing protein [Marinoscillum sp.]|uniref:PepSY-like domain-containing protein n=1 Tax=Marinoscillum sp. TaxID=2024838 RepID=UPI003BACBE69
MKNLKYPVLLTIFVTMLSCAQSGDQVPEKVLSAFNAKFPDAKKVEWEMEDEQEWEAEFKMDGRDYSANFSVAGEWMETEYAIESSELPTAVMTALNENYAAFEIEEAELAETKEGTSYELELEVGDEEFEVTITAAGQIESTQKESEEEDDKD